MSMWDPVAFDDGLADALYSGCGQAISAIELSSTTHVLSAAGKLGDWTGAWRVLFDANERSLQGTAGDIVAQLRTIQSQLDDWQAQARDLRRQRQRQQDEWRAAQAAIAAGREQAGMAATAGQ